jgi:large subunit ribosomal protein L25
MDFAKVTVEIRKETGKGSARRARAKGRVPAVLYGRNEQAISLSVEPLALQRSMDKERKRNTVFSLAVTGDGQAPQEIMAMLREVQIDPLSRQVLHVDFLRVSLDEEVRVTVPLHLTGTPKGVVDGGNLHQSVHMVAVAAKPTAIPTKVDLDVSGLSIGEALHVSDLKLGAGVRALLDAKEALASVVAPKAEKEEVAAEAAPAEGAAAAPGATPGKEGEAAAAPAAGGDKKGAGGKDDKGGDKKK